ncbi:hypothetical protein G9A89_007437 [Geosiphon pyriformis]|nr:hypothetical protein G9A89_007437 [Geosiphon pyriformis]
MMKLQAIALALECVPSSNFWNWCWVKHYHIVGVICDKNLKVSWLKVKEHLDVPNNKTTDTLTESAFLSGQYLFYKIKEHFIRAGSSVVSDNLGILFIMFSNLLVECIKRLVLVLRL